MSNKGKLATGVLAVGVSLVGVMAGNQVAGASVGAVTSAPAKGLVTAAQAKKLGFPLVAGKPTTSDKTKVTGCGKGAQVLFENSTGKSGFVSEVLVCKSAQAAQSLIDTAKKDGAAAATAPVKQLGSTALELAAPGSTYAIYWRQGKLFELVEFDTAIPPASSSSTTTTTSGAVVPITAQQQKTLTAIALDQNSHLS
jgi:hypothetical protein